MSRCSKRQEDKDMEKSMAASLVASPWCSTMSSEGSCGKQQQPVLRWHQHWQHDYAEQWAATVTHLPSSRRKAWSKSGGGGRYWEEIIINNNQLAALVEACLITNAMVQHSKVTELLCQLASGGEKEATVKAASTMIRLCCSAARKSKSKYNNQPTVNMIAKVVSSGCSIVEQEILEISNIN